MQHFGYPESNNRTEHNLPLKLKIVSWRRQCQSAPLSRRGHIPNHFTVLFCVRFSLFLLPPGFPAPEARVRDIWEVRCVITVSTL